MQLTKMNNNINDVASIPPSQEVHKVAAVPSTEYIRTEINGNVPYNAFYQTLGKYIFEIFLFMGIIVPLSLCIIIIYFTLLIPNRGKVIFRQKRIGLNGKEFTIYKFRTLSAAIDIDIEKNPALIKKHSHRVGYFLRRTGLDESLQIINVIKGNMNLIGPRPLLRKDLIYLSEDEFKKRHSIKPGIIGLWQIRRQYNDDKNYFGYDSFYFKKQSLTFDIYIVLYTISYMIKGRGR